VDIGDRPTRTRVIYVPHDLPSPDLSDPDLDGRDRATSSSSGAAERDRTGAKSPGWEARVALARLLGRQAAQEHMQANGARDDL
jgi:hypothetical protein